MAARRYRQLLVVAVHRNAGLVEQCRALLRHKVGFGVLAVVRLKYPGNQHRLLHELLGDRTEILECLRITGEDCYTLKIAATSMVHLEQVVDELARFGSTTTNIVYSQTLPYRGVRRASGCPER